MKNADGAPVGVVLLAIFKYLEKDIHNLQPEITEAQVNAVEVEGLPDAWQTLMDIGEELLTRSMERALQSFIAEVLTNDKGSVQ